MSSLDKRYVWYGDQEVRGDQSVLTPVSVVQILNQYQGIDKYLKILKVDLYSGNIMELIRYENLRGQILIVDDDRLLFAGKLPEIDKDLADYLWMNQEEIVEGRINRYFNWKIINIMDHQDLELALQEPRIRIVLLTLMSLFLSSFIIFLIYRSFYQRLNALSEHVSTLMGEFTSQFPGIRVR